MTDDGIDATGGCYCGRVRYRASGVRPTVTECHCSQCRKTTGHRFATTGTKTSDMTIEGADNITWFRASPIAERGFCSLCGSTLFWKASGKDYTAILAASVDEPSGLRLSHHIFVANIGDYYDVGDELPQFEQSDKPGEPVPEF